MFLLKKKKKHCADPTFAYPVNENEVESVTKSWKGNSSARFDEIAELLFKQYTVYILSKTVSPYCGCFF
jgi:hypothetical protein